MDFIHTKVILISLILAANYASSKAYRVYVKPATTLWVGENGTVVCRVSGEPNRVAWINSTREDLAKTPLAYWTVDDGFVIDDKGKYEMTRMNDDFSLHVQNVSPSDIGSYKCAATFEGVDGQILYSTSEVAVYASKPDGVFMEPTTMLWVGENGTVVCRVSGEPNRVAWSTRDNIHGNTVTAFASWTADAGFVTDDKGKYDMAMTHEDFSLHIQNVSLSDTGSYKCAATVEGVRGRIVYNSSEVTVYDSPDTPYPSVVECPKLKPRIDGTGQRCEVRIALEANATKLTCEARNFFPQVNLTWTTDSVPLESTAPKLTENADGTFNVAVTVEATAGLKLSYLCTASGPAVQGSAVSPLVRVYRAPAWMPSNGSPNQKAMWFGVALGAVFEVLALIFVV